MKAEERKELIAELKELLPVGTTVYTKLNHVAKSGMMRVIEVMIFKDDKPVYLTYSVADLLGYKLHKKYEGLKVGGCGMDMGFSVVYGLSAQLYRESGYECIKDEAKDIRCPSNFHVNTRDKTITEPIHHDGYALKHRWV